MKIHRAYKTELDPNNIQRTAMLKHAGASRFAYNWGLQRKQDIRILNMLPIPHIKTPTAIDLHKELNQLKKTSLSWMYEVSKCAPQEALRDLDRAFKNFFKKRARYPKFKSTTHGNKSFRLHGNYPSGPKKIEVQKDIIKLPRLGWIRLKEKNYLPTKGVHILSATVSEKANRWFVGIRVIEEIKVLANNGEICGVDLGINRLATVSDGTEIENPKALARHMRKLKRKQREISRKQKGSNNRRKAVEELQRLHMRISDIRKDAHHKATTWLAKSKSVVVVEDLNVSGMMKNHHIAGAIADAGMGEFRRQLEYKTKWYGSEIIVANTFFPSSKTCSICGEVKNDLKLSIRTFECDTCHSRIDRDFNAAVNLSRLAVSPTDSINACLRRDVTGLPSADRCPPVIQEPNAVQERILNG